MHRGVGVDRKVGGESFWWGLKVGAIFVGGMESGVGQRLKLGRKVGG